MSVESNQTLRSRAIAAALGQLPFDLLLRSGTLINASTSELQPADVGIVGSLIASVHPQGARTDALQSYDVSGEYLAPGFIDTHVHFESSHFTPENYASIVVPQGTTTILFDPHELANVLGLDGVRYAIEATRGLPLRCICLAPSCVPSAQGLETCGADFGGPEMREMLAWPEVAGVAEVMDMAGLLGQSRRMTDIVSAGLQSGKLVEGHARGLSGPCLQAYLAAGVSSDHEITSAEDALEKLRSGLTVEIRGSHDYVLPGVVQALKQLPHIPSTLTICTDDVPPDYLVENGGLSDVLRRLIRYGLDPVQAIRCATFNAALRLRRDDLGLIAAGRQADIVVLRKLHEIVVDKVFCSGRLTAQSGKMSVPLQASPVRPPVATMKVAPLATNDCRIRIPSVENGRAKLRVIVGARFTSWGEVEVQVSSGYAELPLGYGVILVQHRHGRHNARAQLAVIGDWGEIRGAVATTYSHDSHNLVVIGRSPDDMREAANAVIASGGGFAVAKDGELIARMALPIAGLLSGESPEHLAALYRQVRNAAGQVIEWLPPYRVFKALGGTCLACNPGPHLTDLGLTDAGKFFDILISAEATELMAESENLSLQSSPHSKAIDQEAE
jgi:adenine deaminase